MSVNYPDLLTADPCHTTLLYEDPDLRILKLVVGPEEVVPMHKHPDRIIIYMTDVYLHNSYPDKPDREVMVPRGEVQYNKATVHAGRNIGPEAFYVIEIEVKGRPAQPGP